MECELYANIYIYIYVIVHVTWSVFPPGHALHVQDLKFSCCFWEFISCVIWHCVIGCQRNVVHSKCRYTQTHIVSQKSWILPGLCVCMYMCVCVYIYIYTHTHNIKKYWYIFIYIVCVILEKLLPKPKMKTLDQTSRNVIIWRCHKLGTNHGITAPDAPHRSSLQEATSTETSWW